MVKKYVLLVLVLVISFYSWGFITETTFQNEGFAYFDESAFPFDITKYESYRFNMDTSAKITSHFLSRTYKSNIFKYMQFELFYMLLTIFVFFYFAKLITKSYLVTFIATLLFGISFAGNYDMFANGGYQFFLQRGMLLLPLLISFSLYFIFIEKKNYILYLISLIVYVWTIIMGFFATWFSPTFLFFPVFYSLFKEKKLHFKILIFLSPIPFIIENYRLIYKHQFIAIDREESFLKFLMHISNNLNGVAHQLTTITLSGLWSQNISNFIQLILKHDYAPEYYIKSFEIITCTLYVLAFLYLWFKNSKYRYTILSLLFSVLFMLLFNLYLNGVEVLRNYGSSRYFYYPISLLSIFWAILISSILTYKSKIIKILTIISIFIILIFNVNATRQSFKNIKWRYDAIRQFVFTFENWQWTDEIKNEKSYVYVYDVIGPYGVTFIQRFYSNPESSFSFEKPTDLEISEVKKKTNLIYILEYDRGKNIVVDKTIQLKK